MGSSLQSMGEHMADNMQTGMKKTMAENQKSMMNAQQEMAMRRREMMMAVNMARTRDMLMYFGVFTGALTLFATAALIKKRNPAGFIPVFPLCFICAYQYDLAYGNKLNRVQAEAGRILDQEWRKGDENRFLLPPNNVFMSREKYLEFTKREEQETDDNENNV